jgi:Tol biopolymer transport system component
VAGLGYRHSMRVVTRIFDVSTWPRLVRNGAGVVWVAGFLFVATVVWRAPERGYHAIRCSGGFAGAPSWSPHGTRIAFAKRGSCDTVLFVADSDGSGLYRLAESRGGDRFPAWSPHGDSIAFTTGGSIDVIRPDGHGRARIASDDSPFGLAWSPRGGEIAYSRATDSGFVADPGESDSRLMVMRADGTRSRVVLGHSVVPGTPAWSPDGRRLAFTGTDGLYVMGVHGGRLTRLFDEYFGLNPVAPAWSPDGRTLSFVDDYGLELVDTVVPRLRRRVAIVGGRWGDGSSWAPGGGTIAFSISGGQRPGIYLVQPNGRLLHRIAAL